MKLSRYDRWYLKQHRRKQRGLQFKKINQTDLCLHQYEVESSLHAAFDHLPYARCKHCGRVITVGQVKEKAATEGVVVKPLKILATENASEKSHKSLETPRNQDQQKDK